jgi:eukaryotic-like serine/threonine-protein kinase
MDDDDDPIVQRPDDTRIQPPRAVPPLGDADELNVVHEEERTRVLPDGTVLHETDRVEQKQSRFRELLPWILIAVLGVIILVGLIVWYTTRSDTKAVPNVVGLQVDDAVNRMQADGFKTQIARQANDHAAGIVFSQNPEANVKAGSGSTVHLTVSSGKAQVTVPNAVGRAQADARDQLVNAGFTVTTAQVNSSQPVGTVVAQDPAAGTKATPGTRVRINVSQGPGNVQVPSEVGSQVADARANLTAKGFRPVVTLVPSNAPSGTVVAQSPASGSAPHGSTVSLNVSQGPSTDTTTTPTTPTAPTTNATTATTDTTVTGATTATSP